MLRMDLLGDLAKAVLAPSGDRHVAAQRRKRARGRESEPARRTRDERPAYLEIGHGGASIAKSLASIQPLP